MIPSKWQFLGAKPGLGVLFVVCTTVNIFFFKLSEWHHQPNIDGILTYLALCKEVGGQDIQVNQLKTLESPTALPSPHSSPGLQEGTKLDLSQAPCGTQ